MTHPSSAAPSPLWTVVFDIEMLALSSIVFRESRPRDDADTVTLFAKEKVVSSSGEILEGVPIVSGSSFRGSLRRVSEALTAGVLNYEQRLQTPVAHLLANGGRLAKSAAPLSDEDERTLRRLLPHIALFGGAASARTMSGLVAVEKVMPEVIELEHLLGDRVAGRNLISMDLLMSEEHFSHVSDARLTSASAPSFLTGEDSVQALLSVEVMPAGTRLHSRVRLSNATDLQLSYLRAVLDEFAEVGQLGGRRAAGHGRVSATITSTVRRGPAGTVDAAAADWAGDLATHRAEAIAALAALS